MRYDNIKYSSFHIQLIHTLCANVFCHLDDTFEFCRTDAGREICMSATRTNMEGSKHVRREWSISKQEDSRGDGLGRNGQKVCTKVINRKDINSIHVKYL